MKKKFQFFLFSLIILISLVFYNSYFKSPTDQRSNDLTEKDETKPVVGKNNVIKNLKYDVKFDDNSKYSISSKISEITNTNDNEIVIMKDVTAEFNDGKNPTIYITSDTATFNNSSFNTSFETNVRVEYMENVITSDNLDLNFKKNNVYIYNNVLYEGLTGLMKTDNILINLFTKDAEIFMNSPAKKVEISSK